MASLYKHAEPSRRRSPPRGRKSRSLPGFLDQIRGRRRLGIKPRLSSSEPEYLLTISFQPVRNETIIMGQHWCKALSRLWAMSFTPLANLTSTGGKPHITARLGAFLHGTAGLGELRLVERCAYFPVRSGDTVVLQDTTSIRQRIPAHAFESHDLQWHNSAGN